MFNMREMMNTPLCGKTAPNESFTRKRIGTPKATLGTPPGTGTHVLRDRGHQNRRRNTGSQSSIDAKEALWFSVFLWHGSKIKSHSKLLIYEKMKFKLSYLAELTACDIKGRLLRTEGIWLFIEHSNSKHKVQFNDWVATYSWPESMCQALSAVAWEGGE